MNFKEISITFHTTRISECKSFYEKYFGAKTTFDSGWYATIQFPSAINPHMFLSFMDPQYSDVKQSEGGIVMLNIMVEDVDAEYNKLKTTDINIIEDIADKPWGDRSFRVIDPLGNVVYIYSLREISDEYKDAIKE